MTGVQTCALPILKVNMAKGNPDITVYPNPVSNRMITVKLRDMMKGVYTLRLISITGQAVSTQQFIHNGGSGTQTIGLDRTVANGSYRLEIIKPDNSRMMKALVIINN